MLQQTNNNSSIKDISANQLFLQESIENLTLNIYVNKKKDLFTCIINDGDQQYKSESFTLQSGYREGIIQDCLGEICSSKFFKKYGSATYQSMKSTLLNLLEPNSW